MSANQAKACMYLGQLQVYMEALESLPYRELNAEKVDQFLAAARSVQRASEHLISSIEEMEESL